MSGTLESPSDRRVQTVWILVCCALGGATLASIWPTHHPVLGILEVACGTLACVSLAWRRSYPLPVAVLTTSVLIFSPMALAATIVSVTNAAVSGPARSYLLLSAYVVAVAAAHVAFSLVHAGLLSDQLPVVWVLLPAVGLGWLARARRSQAAAEEQQRIEQARAPERRRIAREMHDVLAHRISIVSVHAGALEVHPDAPAPEIGSAAGVIRASAHAALGELREVITLLRRSADSGGEPQGDSLPRPQPTLDDLPELIQQSRQAGMCVSLDVRLDRPAAIPDATGRTVYRVVQEGLTNARKHASTSEVEVQIADDDGGELTVSVLTRPVAPPRPAATANASPPGTGSGLIGLAERVALADGRLEHAPTPDGGYVLRATLPMPR